MGFGDDEEILQDFLVEAGEILETLSEQLVELEQRPDDRDLLNAIFRGFHTVKGGAGFLQIAPMVECCHVTENLFDILRNGKREVTSELMDVVLQALDAVNSQFDQVQNRVEPSPADESLIESLERLVACEDLLEASDEEVVDEEVVEEESVDEEAYEEDVVADEVVDEDVSEQDISEDEPQDSEFNAQADIDEVELDAQDSQPSASSDDFSDSAIANLLDAIADEDEDGAAKPAVKSTTAKNSPVVKKTESDEITDDEFEALLDQLHGEGKGPSVGESKKAAPEKSEAAPADDKSGEKAKSKKSAGGNSDLITEDEFEKLLDQIHGQGKGPGGQDKSNSSAKAAPAAEAEKVENANPKEEKTEDVKAEEVKAPAPKAAKPKSESPKAKAKANDDTITEDEFEALLDQLHGAGKGPGAGSSDTKVASTKAASSPPKNTTAPKTTESKETVSEKSDVKAEKSEPKKEPVKTAAKAPAAPKKPATTKASEPDKSAAIKAVPGTGKPSTAAAKPELVAVPGGAKASAAKPASPPAAAPKEAAAPAAETTVRVDTQRLDDIMNMVGELVLVRNRLVRLGDEKGDEVLSKAVSNLDVVTADLQTAVMKTRMQPIKKVFGRFPRVVRDLARSLGKEISLELVGEETDLDKNLVEALADPLVHLVRNSVDHGIELPDVREQKGKPRVGRVVLSAQQEGDHILLAITDDGGGMDPNKLKSIAVAKGVLDEDAAARLSDQEAFALIFAPGFSTKQEISDVSGRGVGMDVVKTKITQLNGTIEIDSVVDEGTKLYIKVPLTLAIMPTLMIMLDDQTFALPLVNVDEIFHMDLSRTNIVDGQECVTIREKAIPLFHLKRWLIRSAAYATPPKEGHIVIVSVGTQRVGFVVDQLIGQEEVVIKPLGKMLHGTPGMAGATITGDGRIALILDVPSMLKRYAGNAA
ncbi:chemotaxis protein CheA [Sessilibacter sp. MAH4]